jgi:hypothetical protein
MYSASPPSTTGQSEEAKAFLGAQPLEDFMGPRGTLRYVINDRGISLACYFWPAEGEGAPKGIIQVTHGHGRWAHASDHAAL